ncbi:MAG: penicillin-binding transpeptidase domain-containing protein [Planctomycetota bacterium]|jgi:cell division protein FtsI/penicillin-binding protein 2|nr:penicillin-binding transpeptidase domain-containing protein [Planctomycetota bacterium]
MREGPELSAAANSMRYVALGLVALLVIGLARVLDVHASKRYRPKHGELGQRSRTVWGPRGDILDRAGRPLATSVLSYDVEVECYANEAFPPSLVVDVCGALERAGRLSPRERQRIQGIFELPQRDRRHDLWEDGRSSQGPWRWFWKRPLAKGVQSAAVLRDLEKLGKKRIRGHRFRILLKEAWKRVYPLGRGASHVVGMVAKDEKGRTVTSGLEAMPVLAARGRLRQTIRRSARGTHYANGLGPLALVSSVERARVVTTIDRTCQETAAALIDAAVSEAGAKWGVLTLIDLESGEVLALAGAPNFAPEFRKKGDNYWPMTHWARFEPGSAIKPLVVGLALDLGLVRAGQMIKCRGDSGGRRWRMRHGRAARVITDDHLVGDVSLERLMIESSNIGAVRVGTLGGREFHSKMLRLFRLRELPCVGLPLPESRVDGGGVELQAFRVPSEQTLESRQYTLYTGPSLSFGYELSVDTLAFTRAHAMAITGRDFELRLVRELRPAEKPAVRLPVAGPGKRILSESTVRWLRETLARVVTDPKGTARFISSPDTDGVIGGKTGTSVRTTGGRVSNAIFVGFSPVERPRWLSLAVVQKAGTVNFYGGKFAAPAVRDLLSCVRRSDGRKRLSEADAGYLRAAGGRDGGK